MTDPARQEPAPTEQGLREAVIWALGLGDDFRPREPGEGAYWWRRELAQRAGITPEQINALAHPPAADAQMVDQVEQGETT